MSKHLI